MKAKIIAAALTILLLPGCSIERNLKLDARLAMPPAVKQLPLRMEVRYSPEFVAYTKKIELFACGPYGRRDKYDISYIFPIGISSRDLFDQVAQSMFSTVTVTSASSQSQNNPASIDGVLEPRIESFNWQFLCSNDYFSTAMIEARVSYVINLYNSPDGVLVASINVEGVGIEKPEVCFRNCRDSIAAEKTMQDAMAKFMIIFYERPEVRKWLSAHGEPHGDRK